MAQMDLSNYDLKNPSHRALAMQEKVRQLQAGGMEYDEAWSTANAAPEMGDVVAAMKTTAADVDSLVDDLSAILTNGMVWSAISELEKSLNEKGFLDARSTIEQNDLFRPLVEYKSRQKETGNTANAAGIVITRRQTNAKSLREMLGDCVVGVVRAALGGAVNYLTTFLKAPVAIRETYAHPLFKPLADFIATATGDLSTSNAFGDDLEETYLRYLLNNAVRKHGASEIRSALKALPGAAALVARLLSVATDNAEDDKAPALSKKQASEEFTALARKIETEKNCSWDEAWCSAKRAEPELFEAMLEGR